MCLGHDISVRQHFKWPHSAPCRGWSGGAKVLCILHHWGVQLILAYGWASPAILVVGKGRGGMFLFLLFLHFHSCSSFFPVPLFHLLYSLLSLFSLSLGDDTKWPSRVDVSLNPNTIKISALPHPDVIVIWLNVEGFKTQMKQIIWTYNCDRIIKNEQYILFLVDFITVNTGKSLTNFGIYSVCEFLASVYTLIKSSVMKVDLPTRELTHLCWEPLKRVFGKQCRLQCLH